MFKFIKLIVLLLAILSICSVIYAGNYGNNRSYVNSYNNYNNKQANIVEYVDVIQKRVEFDADYFFGVDGYYDVINELKDEEYTKDKDIYLKQSEQMDKLIELLEILIKNKNVVGGGAEGNPPANNGGGDKPAVPPSVNSNNTTSSDKYSEEALNKKVFTIFKDNCMACHGQESPKAGLQLIGENADGSKWLNDLSLVDRTLVYDSVSGTHLKERGKKLMPLGGSPLPDSEVEDIKLWMLLKAEQDKKSR